MRSGGLMSTRTGAARRWAWQWISALCAAVLAAALVTATPVALADPGQEPGDPAPAPVVDVPPPDPVAPAAAAAPVPVPAPAPAPDAAVPAAPSDQGTQPAAAPGTQPSAAPAGTYVAGQNPEPFTGTPPFRPPTFNPVNGATVGVAKPIYINFAVPITDRAMAEQAIHISSNPPVPGRFYWINDSQVRWRPQDFWPAGTTVNIDAAGTKSSFRVGDLLIANVDNSTHTMQVFRNGKLEKTMPVSMGMPGHDTPNGTYYVLEKFPDIVMDSATYGVPNTSPQGYKVHVQLAVRFDNSGNFVHSAPWSVADQGKRNVSHGCINISPDNAKWFFDNFGSGDPIVIRNSVGTYNKPDGASDWQMF
ncbi:MAG: L,D-transpeptidase [Mycobacteriaceae bacterium]|nr:L,D-transpeptidase [Mycobacteriaceae bacterium]